MVGMVENVVSSTMKMVVEGTIFYLVYGTYGRSHSTG